MALQPDERINNTSTIMWGSAELTNESPRKPRYLIHSEVHAEPIDSGDTENEFVNVEDGENANWHAVLLP